MFRLSLLAASVALAGTGAAAQQAGSHNPAIKNGHPHPVAVAAQGRNSFTEDQAHGRLAKAGYTGVSKLAKDANGVWRGTATKGGHQMAVGVDYKGNVTAR
jgi:hypothetical protein